MTKTLSLEAGDGGIVCLFLILYGLGYQRQLYRAFV